MLDILIGVTRVGIDSFYIAFVHHGVLLLKSFLVQKVFVLDWVTSRHAGVPIFYLS